MKGQVEVTVINHTLLQIQVHPFLVFVCFLFRKEKKKESGLSD